MSAIRCGLLGAGIVDSAGGGAGGACASRVDPSHPGHGPACSLRDISRGPVCASGVQPRSAAVSFAWLVR
eukprot:2088018-Prymnesium_polylepis.2